MKNQFYYSTNAEKEKELQANQIVSIVKNHLEYRHMKQRIML